MAKARHPKANFFVQRLLFSGLNSFAELEQKIAALPGEKSQRDLTFNPELAFLLSAFDKIFFLFGQAVKVINEPVNLRVGGGDLAFERGFLRRRPGGGQGLPVRLHFIHGLGRGGESIEQYL
jgi:hypothetical protein